MSGKLLQQAHPHQSILESAEIWRRSAQILRLPAQVPVLKLDEPTASFESLGPFAIGRYDELRPTLYQAELFTQGGAESRCVHMGIDIGGPVGAELFAWTDSVVYAQGALASEGDYGHSVVLESAVTCSGVELKLWSLYGHLSADSLSVHAVGERVGRGELIGRLGAAHENGGWPPHVHFQLSWLPPEGFDLPGVTSRTDRQRGLWTFPDPRLALGPLY